MAIDKLAQVVRRCRRTLLSWRLFYDDTPKCDASGRQVPGDGWPTRRTDRLLPRAVPRCRRALLALADLADQHRVDAETTLPLRGLADWMTTFPDRTRDYEYPPGAARPVYSSWRPRAFAPEVMGIVSLVEDLVDRIAAMLSAPQRTATAPNKSKITPTVDMRALALVRRWDEEVRAGKREPFTDQDVATAIGVKRTYLADKRKCPGYRRWKQQRKQRIDHLDGEGLSRDRRSTAPGVACPKQDDTFGESE